jgi:hypothetical protein
MIDLTSFYQEGINYLHTWRNRYSKQEYPYKVAVNILYRKYHMVAMWNDVCDCMRFDHSGNQQVKWNDSNVGFQKLLDIYSSKTILVNPGFETRLQNDSAKEIGDTSFDNFRQNIANAQSGSAEDLESIEFAYLYYKLTDQVILYLAAMCGTGMKPMDAMARICQIIFQVDLTSYSQCVAAIGRGCVAPWMNTNYKPLDNLISSESMTNNTPVPSNNTFEILTYYNQIVANIDNYNELQKLYSKISNYNHPQINYGFGFGFLNFKDMINAKTTLINGVKYGLKYPCPLYDTLYIDAVAQCIYLLLADFSIDNNIAIKLTSLAYVYLSNCIENYSEDCFDSYKTRAMLLNENDMITNSIIMDNVGLGKLKEPYIISDFYFASQISGSPHHSALNSARKIHQWLEDISVGGKDADEYTLQEMADFGKKRHLLLYITLANKYKAGKFDITLEELTNAIH